MSYNVLKGKIVEKDIDKLSICKELGISYRSLNNKINGKSDFTWTQACIIHNKFFPELNKDELFHQKTS